MNSRRRSVLQETPNHVEHLVRAEGAAHGFELVQQDLEHSALAGFAGHEIDDANVVLLAVPVNAPHPLFQARRVPRDVVVHHQATELEIDSFARCIGSDEKACAVRLAKPFDLLLAFRPAHAAVDDCDLVGVAETFDASHQKIHGVAVLGEDQPLVHRVPGIFEDFSELFELGLVPRVNEGKGASTQALKNLDLPPQLFDGDGSDRAEHCVFEVLAALAGGDAVFTNVLFGAMGVEEIVALPPRQKPLAMGQARLVQATGLPVGHIPFELVDSAFERTQQRRRRAGEPALKDAHGELCGRPVAMSAAVVLAQVGGGVEVERLLPVLALGEVEAERAACPLPIQRVACEVHHLLLRAPDEVALPRIGRKATQRLSGAECVVVEQSPKMMPR